MAIVAGTPRRHAPGVLRLRLGEPLSLAGLAVVSVALLKMGWLSDLSLQLALVLGVVRFFAGLAVIHAVFAKRGLHRGWLIGLYII